MRTYLLRVEDGLAHISVGYEAQDHDGAPFQVTRIVDVPVAHPRFETEFVDVLDTLASVVEDVLQLAEGAPAWGEESGED